MGSLFTDVAVVSASKEEKMKRLILHESLWIRFLSMLGVGVFILLVFWSLSYQFLPEEVLRGRTGAAVLAGAEAAATFLAEFVRIALLNLFMMTMIIIANRLLEINGVPLGYFPPLFLSVIYAITLGTNSFSIPLPRQMPPSFGVLLRSGPYEIAAYILMAVSTYELPIYRFKRLIPPDSEAIEPEPAFTKNVEWLGFILAILILLIANAYEANQIVSLASS